MKFNKWTVGLAAVGVVSLASAARADEQMSQVQTALTQTTLSGYVDTAMQYNPGTDRNAGSVEDASGPQGNGNNIPSYAFAKNDGFSFNALDIALDRPEDSSAWAAGYHIELMAGADAVGVGGAGGAAVRQAFVRLHTPVGGNGIDWQIGIFDNLIGYESNSDPLNPNYTRSYGYTIEPTTLTGVSATYKINDMLTVEGAVANTPGGLGTIAPAYISTTVYESQKTYTGLITFTAPDSMGFLKGATASAGVVDGNDSQKFGHGQTVNWYGGATVPTPVSQLKVGVAYDYLMESDKALTGVNIADNIWVLGGYGTWQFNDKLSLNVRGEYFSDSSNPGDTVNLYNNFHNPFGPTLPGNNGEEITATLQYNLWANVITRGEFRWDHVEHGSAFGASSATPVDGEPYRSNDFMLALNIIYQF
jgi:hypothetical protein